MKKIFNYFSIFTIIFGTTFGSINSANATQTLTATSSGLTLDVDGAATTAADLEADDATDLVTFASDATALTISLSDGDITIVSITADTAADATITILDASASGRITITGGINQADGVGNLIIKTSDDGSTIDVEDNITNSTGGVGIIKFQLDDTDTLEMNGNDKTVAATVDGIAAAEGIIKVSDETTFTGAIGSNFRIKTIDNDDVATFSSTVETATLDIDGATTFSSTLNVSTTSNLDGGTVNLDGATTFTGVVTVEDIAVIASDAVTSTAGMVLGHASAILRTDNASDVTIAGIIDGATSAGTEGKIDIEGAGTVTFSGALGATNAAAQLKEIDVNDTHTAIFSSTVDAATLTVEGNATFTGIATTTTLDLNGGDAHFTATLVETASATSSINIDATSRATFNAGNTTEASANVMDTITTASGGIIEITKGVTNGMYVFKTTDQDATTLNASSKIYLPVNLSNGQTLKLFGDTDNGGDVDDRVNSIMQDTALTDYTASEASQVVTVTSTDKSSTTTASELGVTENIAKALLQARNSAINDTNADGTAEDAFYNALNAEGGYSATEDTALAKQVAPQDDMISGSTVAAQAVTGSVQGIMSSRMASLRSGDAYFGTGVAAGGMSAQSGFIQVFGSTAEQNNKTVGSGTQYGYESDTEGLAIGFDGVTDDGMTIGVSLATANTDVDGKGTGKSTNSIDTYSASLYMDRATDAGYIEGSLTYGINENTTSRKVNTAGLDRTYTGSYDSQSLSINISAGAPNEVGNGYLTPFGSFTASFMDIDAYTEKSTVANDNLRLKVAQDDVNSMIGTLGIKYHAEMSNGGTPMISLAINNEFGDTTIDSTNTYQGGGTAFKTSTAVEELSATLGLGYSYGSDSTSIELAYEADVNDDEYLSHYGSIKLVGKF